MHFCEEPYSLGVATLTITMSKLSRPGILEDPPEFYTDWATNLLNVPLFFCNVSELCHISQKKLFWRVITQSFEYVFTMKRRPSTQMLLRNIAPSSLNWPLVTKNILCLKNHLKLERSNFFGSELLRESLDYPGCSFNEFSNLLGSKFRLLYQGIAAYLER